MNEEEARKIVFNVEEKHRSAAVMLAFGKIEPEDYNHAEWFLIGLESERKRSAKLVEALKVVRDGYLAEPGSDFDWHSWYEKTENVLAAYSQGDNEGERK